MPNRNDIDARLAAACNMAERVRALTLPAFVRGMDPENKNHKGVFDPVTEADKGAERFPARPY